MTGTVATGANVMGFDYDKKELQAIIRAFKLMDQEATEEAKQVSGELADYALEKIRQAAYEPGMRKVAAGGKVIKSSKIGEIRIGYAGQKFSGGGTTEQLWPGYEFGSHFYKQFAPWSGKFGRGSRGKFIYPTLRRIQPDIVRRWEEALAKIMRKWA